MKLALTVALLFLPTMSLAQTTLPANTEITLKLTLQDAEKVWKGLRKLPVEEVEDLMNKLRQQVTEQTQLKSEPDKK